ncbi:hypothetical protein ENUP19_0339G0004 [Entamoeba nuttalli]|uniref:Uncharacterized protein n=1 Tax=Entamoeba nuttalli TaxID=412467 RepID=A0ABQ0DX08_9EUKA
MKENKIQVESRNGLFLPKLPPKIKEINETTSNKFFELKKMEMTDDALGEVCQMLNWTSFSFDEYMEGLIAPIPLQQPIYKEPKLSDLVNLDENTEEIDVISLPENFCQILEEDFYSTTKVKKPTSYPPALPKTKRIYFD